MRRILTGLLALVFTIALTTNAHAGLLTSHLSLDGIEDVLDDDSVSLIVDNDSDNAISVGDYLLGVSRFGVTTENGVLANTDQLIGYYGFVVLATDNGPGPIVTISASAGVNPAAGSGFSIDELFGTALGTSAAFAILSKDPEASDITRQTFGAAITALGAYTLDAVLGFSASNSHGDADYLEIQATSDANDNGKLNFSELPPESPSGSFVASKPGGLSVLQHTLASSVIFLPVQSTHSDGTTNTFHDFGLSGTIFGRRINTPSGWSLTESLALAVNPNPIPEPSSLTLFGLALLGIGAFRRRRKNKGAAAS